MLLSVSIIIAATLQAVRKNEQDIEQFSGRLALNNALYFAFVFIESRIVRALIKKLDFLSLKKDGELILALKNFDTKINLYKILFA